MQKGLSTFAVVKSKMQNFTAHPNTPRPLTCPLPPLWLPCAVGGYLHSVIFATLGSINVNMELLSLFIQVDRRVHDTRVRGGGGGEVKGLRLCVLGVCVCAHICCNLWRKAQKNIKTVLCANEITKAGFVCVRVCVCEWQRAPVAQTHTHTHTRPHTHP